MWRFPAILCRYFLGYGVHSIPSLSKLENAAWDYYCNMKLYHYFTRMLLAFRLIGPAMSYQGRGWSNFSFFMKGGQRMFFRVTLWSLLVSHRPRTSLQRAPVSVSAVPLRLPLVILRFLGSFRSCYGSPSGWRLGVNLPWRKWSVPNSFSILPLVSLGAKSNSFKCYCVK